MLFDGKIEEIMNLWQKLPLLNVWRSCFIVAICKAKTPLFLPKKAQFWLLMLLADEIQLMPSTPKVLYSWF